MTLRLVRPYADADGIFRGIDYRSLPSEPFAPIEFETDTVMKVVIADDLRSVPQHEFKINLDLGALEPHYSKHLAKIHFAILLRDSILRREHVLGKYPIKDVPATIRLDRKQLQLTAFRDVLPITFVVLATEHLGNALALPTQKSSRLAELNIIFRNSANGASFPYRPASPEEFVEERLPSDTAVHLRLRGDPAELLASTDAPIENLMEVLVHQKIWSAMQTDRNPASVSLRIASVTTTTVGLILAAVAPLLGQAKGEIAFDSVVGKLILFFERSAKLADGSLRLKFQESGSVAELMPFAQSAFRMTTSCSRVDEDSQI